MKKIIRSVVVFILFTITPLISFSQGKIDTVYFDAQNKVLNGSANAAAYEIRSLSKRGKADGVTKRFNLKNEIIESTTYQKGRKTGAYMLVKGDSIIRGTYERGKKINLWTYEHKETSAGRIEMYSEQGERSRLDQPLADEVAEKLQINSDAFFPGGPAAWTGFLRNTLRYPASAKNSGAQGAVRVKFIVSKTGTVEDIAVVSSPDASLSAEAIRIMQKSPNWVSAREEGKRVSSEMNLQIVFRLK